MLGWEFPPLFSGGLGIATYGLVKALSKNHHIRLIIPSAASVLPIQNVNIVGLDKVTINEIDTERIRFDFSFVNTEVHRLPIAISPYHHTNLDLNKNSLLNFEVDGGANQIQQTIHHLFATKEIYGHDILYKIRLFGSLAEQIASDHDFDLIHAHDWVTFLAGVAIKRKSSKPLVIHVHALETDRGGGGWVRNDIYDIEKMAMVAADKIIAVSQYTKNEIIKHYQIAPNKIAVVHNGIDPAEPVRQTHRLKDKLVVFLGRLTHQKGPESLLDTAMKVSRVYPRVKFVVAGTGDQFTHMLSTSAYHKLGSKFIFTGFLSKEKVETLLSMADVYFMPSVSEPFGLTALEAAQHHVPSVISSQSGAAEVITSSLQADFWDTDKFANYIYALLNYKALHEEVAQNTFNQARSLTWDQGCNQN
jgi:glycosyltransferase involved in cell wall biosynthesis